MLVRGELGTGKTTLVRGAARALGVSDPVTSPTFAIGHRYRGSRVTVAHLDLYRLAGLGHEDPGLLEDYLGPESIAFVEWPEESSPELEGARLRVTLTHRGGDRRRVEVQEVGEAREVQAGDLHEAVTLPHRGGDRRRVEVQEVGEAREPDDGGGRDAGDEGDEGSVHEGSGR